MPDAKPLHSYNTVQPYLIIRNCGAASDFYKAACGATERMRATRPDGRIGHAEKQIGDNCVMMADVQDSFGYKWWIATAIRLQSDHSAVAKH